MIWVVGALLLLSAAATCVLFCAVRINAMTTQRCDRCGIGIEAYTGVRDLAGHTYCSTSCADIDARAHARPA